MQERLDREPERMRARRETVEHPYGTIKSWIGSTHFLTRGLPSVSTEMSLHVMAYNLKRMMNIFGVKPLIAPYKPKPLVSAFIRGIPRLSEAFSRSWLCDEYHRNGLLLSQKQGPKPAENQFCSAEECFTPDLLSYHTVWTQSSQRQRVTEASIEALLVGEEVTDQV
jgi:hypothetical protein